MTESVRNGRVKRRARALTEFPALARALRKAAVCSSLEINVRSAAMAGRKTAALPCTQKLTHAAVAGARCAPRRGGRGCGYSPIL